MPAQVERDEDTLALPYYDNFNLHLGGRDLAALQAFRAGNYGARERDRLEALGLIRYNEFARNRRGDWELTKKGQIPFGELSLSLFNEIQEPLLIEKHDRLEAVAAEAYARPGYEARLAEIEAEARPMVEARGSEDTRRLHELNNELWMLRDRVKNITMDYMTAITDLRLYRAQWRRILSCALYFLEVQPVGLYKIGVTTRDIEDRLSEIQGDLRQHSGGRDAKIAVIGTWRARGNVELYFKHRYGAANAPIGPLTEYFKFEDIAAVVRDLRRMKAKELTPLEEGILRGDPSPLEERLHLEEIEQRRRAAIRVGMHKASARGNISGVQLPRKKRSWPNQNTSPDGKPSSEGYRCVVRLPRRGYL